MTPSPLVLLGAGGHAAVVADAARLAGWEILGLFADAPPALEALEPFAHLGTIADAAGVLADPATSGHGPVAAHAAIGDARLRRAWLEALPDTDLPAIVHPRAIVSPEAAVRAGAFVGPGAIVNAGAVIGHGAIVNSGAIVEHDVRLGAFCHVAPGAVLGGAASVGPDALVGLNATVMPGVVVGAAATVGAGAVVVRSVPPGATVIGTPAGPRSRVPSAAG